MKIHELKIKAEFYDKIISGEKTAELRLNDRDYKVGDVIYFNQIISKDGQIKKPKYRHRADKINIFFITDVLADKTYIQPGYVMLSFKRLYIRPGLCVFENNRTVYDPLYILNNLHKDKLEKWIDTL